MSVLRYVLSKLTNGLVRAPEVEVEVATPPRPPHIVHNHMGLEAELRESRRETIYGKKFGIEYPQKEVIHNGYVEVINPETALFMPDSGTLPDYGGGQQPSPRAGENRAIPAGQDYDMTKHVAFSNIPGLGRPMVKDENGDIILNGPWEATGDDLEIRKKLGAAVGAVKVMRDVKHEIWQGGDPDEILARIEEVKDILTAGSQIIKRYEDAAEENAEKIGVKPSRPANFDIR